MNRSGWMVVGGLLLLAVISSDLFMWFGQRLGEALASLIALVIVLFTLWWWFNRLRGGGRRGRRR